MYKSLGLEDLRLLLRLGLALVPMLLRLAMSPLMDSMLVLRVVKSTQMGGWNPIILVN